MSTPYGDELLQATQELIHQISYGTPNSTKTIEAIIGAARAMARYEMAQEDNVIVVVPQPEPPEDEPVVVHLPEADVLALLDTVDRTRKWIAGNAGGSEAAVALYELREAYVRVADKVKVPPR
jgi:hypothetical protein